MSEERTKIILKNKSKLAKNKNNKYHNIYIEQYRSKEEMKKYHQERLKKKFQKQQQLVPLNNYRPAWQNCQQQIIIKKF